MGERQQLCVLSPDPLYALRLREASFPTFDLRVFQSLDEVEQHSAAIKPDICLIFGSQFTHLSLAETLLFIREKFRSAKILQVEGVSEPTVRQVWPAPVIKDIATNPFKFHDVDSLDTVVQNISSGWEALVAAGKSLTGSQIGIAQLAVAMRPLQRQHVCRHDLGLGQPNGIEPEPGAARQEILGATVGHGLGAARGLLLERHHVRHLQELGRRRHELLGLDEMAGSGLHGAQRIAASQALLGADRDPQRHQLGVEVWANSHGLQRQERSGQSLDRNRRRRIGLPQRRAQ